MKHCLCIIRAKIGRVVIIILTMIILSLAFVLIPNVLLSMDHKIYSAECELYGEHSLILFNRSKKIDDILHENHSDKEHIITFFNLGTITMNDHQFDFGAIDFDDGIFFSIRNGRLPKNTDEIVLCESLCSEYSLNDIIEIKLNNEVKHFTVVGFINDYYQYWNVPDNIVPDFNDYPKAFIKDKAYQYTSICTIYYNDHLSDNEIVSEAVASLLSKCEEVLFNNNLFSGQFFLRIQRDRVYVKLIEISILILNVFSVSYQIFLFVDALNQTISVLETTGDTPKSICVMLSIISIIETIISYGLSLFVCILLGVQRGGISKLLFVFIFNLLITAAGSVFIYLCSKNKKERKYSSIENINKDFYFSFIHKDVRITKGCVIVLFLSTLVFFVLFGLFYSDINSIVRSNDKYYSITASVESNWTSISVGDFECFSLNRCFDFAKVDDLLELDGVEYIRRRYGGLNSSIVLDDENKDYYWVYLYNTTKQTDKDKKYGNTGWEKIEAIKAINQAFYIEVLPNEVYDSLCEDYSVEGDLLLFCPTITDKGTIISQQYYKDGDRLILGAIYFIDSFTTEFDYSQVGYKEEKYRITKVINAPFSYFDDYQRVFISSFPTIVLSESKAQETMFADRLITFQVFLDHTIDESNYNIILNSIKEITSMNSGVVLRQSKEIDSVNSNIINLMRKVLGCILIMFIIAIYAFTMVCMRLVHSFRQYDYMVLFLTGIEKRDFIRIILYEYLFYYAVFSSVALLVSVPTTYYGVLHLLNFELMADDIEKLVLKELITLLIILIPYVVMVVGKTIQIRDMSMFNNKNRGNADYEIRAV